jgi:hypothetical protein
VVDELTAKERVYDTVEQLANRTERLISIGYLVDEEIEGQDAGAIESLRSRKISETIPLDIWNKNYPNDQNMNRFIKKTIEKIKVSESFPTLGLICFFFLSNSPCYRWFRTAERVRRGSR